MLIMESGTVNVLRAARGQEGACFKAPVGFLQIALGVKSTGSKPS